MINCALDLQQTKQGLPSWLWLWLCVCGWVGGGGGEVRTRLSQQV